MSEETRISELMAMPYSRCLVPEEGGGFSAYVRELPGCYSLGDTVDEAYANLAEAMHNWLEASLRAGRDIPPPVEDWHGRAPERTALRALLKWREADEVLQTALDPYFVRNANPTAEDDARLNLAADRENRTRNALRRAADALEGEE